MRWWRNREPRPPARKIAYCRPRRIAGTAWNAASGRHAARRSRTAEKNRGDGLERPPVGTAARRTAGGSSAVRLHGAQPRARQRSPLQCTDHAERWDPPRGGHFGTEGPFRRPPSAGCADQRSAFQAVPALRLLRQRAVRTVGPRCRPEVGPVLPVGAPLPAYHPGYWRPAELRCAATNPAGLYPSRRTSSGSTAPISPRTTASAMRSRGVGSRLTMISRAPA